MDHKAHKYVEGDLVKVKYWPDAPAQLVRNIVFDGLGTFYNLDGGGTFGEGALVLISPSANRQRAIE